MASCPSLSLNAVENSKSDISFKCGFCGSSVFTENEFIIHIKDHYKKEPSKRRIFEPVTKQESQHPNTSSDVASRRGVPVLNNPLGIGKSTTADVPDLTNDQPREVFVQTDCAHDGGGKTFDEVDKCSVSNVAALDLPEINWKCSKCNYSTRYKKYFIRHNIRTHSLEKQWKCVKCDYSTKLKSTLVLHMHKHSLETKWKCSKCNYFTHDGTNIERHISSHSRENWDVDLRKFIFPC